jgi:hypothetical protein
VTEDDLAAGLHAAGVTHLSFGMFSNPAWWGFTPTYERWRDQWDSEVRPRFEFARGHGFRVTAIGDDVLRTATERGFLAGWAHTEAAFEHVAQSLADLGVCDGVEMVDEIHPDPAFYEPALSRFLAGWQAVEGAPPLAWPSLGVVPAPTAWEVPELAGYCSRYWDTLNWRTWHTDTATGYPKFSSWEMWYAIEFKSRGVPDWSAWGCLASCMGPSYQKLAAGGDYQAGDRVILGGIRPQDVVTAVWLGVAYGSSQTRVYAYDRKSQREARANGPVGGGHDTGSWPGDERWPAISAACNAIGSRLDALDNGTVYVPVKTPGWVFGRRGNLRFGVNILERAQASPNGPGVVLTPGGEAAGSSVPAGCVIFWDSVVG